MKTVNVAVMDYRDGSIKMYDIERRDNYDSEDIESWLVSNTNYSDSSCYYMYSEKEIPIIRAQEVNNAKLVLHKHYNLS